jgi:hypothetical protein
LIEGFRQLHELPLIFFSADFLPFSFYIFAASLSMIFHVNFPSLMKLRESAFGNMKISDLRLAVRGM